MRKIERISDSVFGLENSSVDSNRFYSILLDAKAASVSENMCDIAEKLLLGEKENAKIALDQLWNLKKNLLTETNATIDLLIDFYQSKMDILRNKEEHIKKVSKDSRSLLEEKRKRDEEIASVKQQILDCSRELEELTAKLEKLKTKEQELTLIEQQLKKELNFNENEIVNGLYEIILSQQDEPPIASSTQQSEIVQNQTPHISELDPESTISDTRIIEEGLLKDAHEIQAQTPEILEESESIHQQAVLPQVPEIVPEIPPFPKSVVKTTRGRVIGEYYYDVRVYKNERHYILNSRFFSEQLAINLKLLKQRFDQPVYSETLQMIQDAYKRVAENKMLHFEVSTNEIINEKNLKQLWQDLKVRSMDEADRFSLRLKAKIEALGTNYTAMLQEQMKRCTGN